MDDHLSLVRNRIGNPKGRVNNATGPTQDGHALAGQPHGNLFRKPVQYHFRQFAYSESPVVTVDPELDVPPMDAGEDRTGSLVFCADHFDHGKTYLIKNIDLNVYHLK